jgi:hypothetical protein
MKDSSHLTILTYPNELSYLVGRKSRQDGSEAKRTSGRTGFKVLRRLPKGTPEARSFKIGTSPNVGGSV